MAKVVLEETVSTSPKKKMKTQHRLSDKSSVPAVLDVSSRFMFIPNHPHCSRPALHTTFIYDYGPLT